MHTATLATALLMLAAALPAQAQTATTCAAVEVENVRPQQGQLMLAAYASAETFQKQPLAVLRLPAGDAVMRFQVCGLAGDTVALTLFQDLDADGKMGRNPIGIPTEPWGSSGTPGAFGPSWETSRVALDGKTIVVKMSF